MWRWTQHLIKSFENSKKLVNAVLRGMPHSGCPSTSVNPTNETKVDTLI